MSENKTRPTDASVLAYLDAIDDPARRAHCDVLVEHMQRIVGFGSYHYVYDSRREGDMCLSGFSSRTTALSIYIMSGFEDRPELMERLGKYKTGKSCLYVKRLSDIDLDVLDERIADSVERMKVRYGPD